MITRDIKEAVVFLKKEALPNTCILLDGVMGAGKTTLTKLLLKEMDVKEIVSSPTFVILNQYKAKDLNINHMDAYRLGENDDVQLYTEHFYDSLNIVEWSRNLKIDLQKYFKVIEVKISIIDENTREFLIGD